MLSIDTIDGSQAYRSRLNSLIRQSRISRAAWLKDRCIACSIPGPSGPVAVSPDQGRQLFQLTLSLQLGRSGSIKVIGQGTDSPSSVVFPIAVRFSYPTDQIILH